MKTLNTVILAGVLTLTALTRPSMASEAFSKTDPGTIEIKELPAGRLLEAESGGDYFDDSNQLFRPLFNYIQRNGISMTTPVEAQMEPGKMFFWVADDQKDRAEQSTESVTVVDVPKRKVLSIGARGEYSESNFEKAKTLLVEWLEANDAVTPISEPYAVYWNGPITPWFLKTFEVHVQLADSNK